MSNSPWNGWYHCLGSTYGTWLPGDPRGFRTRKHRMHVEGDYRNPPRADLYDELYESAKQKMQHEPVVLSTQQREIVCAALVGRLLKLNVEALCVCTKHFHVLCRFPNWQSPGIAIPGLCPQNTLQDGRDPVPRHLLGMARKHASHILREARLKSPGPLWAQRPKCMPVDSASHFQSLVPYILTHALEGAATWSRASDEAQ